MTVYLVGAGPGDPDLITVRGAELLRRAEVIVFDRLIDHRLLGIAPMTADKIDVGKEPGQPHKQQHINELLVGHGRTADVVVRLKGGDPFVFGRGGEEALALREAGIPFEVVPGITSAVAAPAYGGVPVTHRGVATSFTVVTGHRMANEPDVDWQSLGKAGGTIVVLMGVTRRAEIAAQLMQAGRSPDQSVVAIRKASHDDQQVVRTTLAYLGSAEIEPPSTLVIGPVASLSLDWFEASGL